MTNQEKREYLRNYQQLQNRIVGLTHEIEKWKTIGEKVNNAIGCSGGSSSGNNSKVENSAVNTSDILKEIQIEINSALQKRDAILNTIRGKSRKMRHRELLEMHYINGMSTAKIAKILKKEEKTVQNAISKAVNELDI